MDAMPVAADHLVGLDDEQREAVLAPRGPLCVLAGAGTGKARTITHRIAHLVGHHGVDPAELLAVTFTNKAAKEMKLRLQSMLPVNVNAMWIGTFHGLCNRFLRAVDRV